MSALENRIPPPLVVLVLGAIMWAGSGLTPHWEVPDGIRLALSSAVFAAGLLIGGAGIMAFRRAKTTIDPVNLDAASTLVAGGIFRISRNPMYVGFAMLLSAWGVYLAAPWSLTGVAVFVLFTWRFQIVPEERVMKAKFGQPYEDYCRQVRRWL